MEPMFKYKMDSLSNDELDVISDLLKTERNENFDIVGNNNNNNFDFSDLFDDNDGMDLVSEPKKWDNWVRKATRILNDSFEQTTLFVYLNSSKISPAGKLKIDGKINETLLNAKMLLKRLSNTKSRLLSQIGLEKRDKEVLERVEADITDSVSAISALISLRENDLNKKMAKHDRVSKVINDLKDKKGSKNKNKVKKLNDLATKYKKAIGTLERLIINYRQQLKRNKDRRMAYILAMSYYELETEVLETYMRYMIYFEKKVCDIIERAKSDSEKYSKIYEPKDCKLKSKAEWYNALYEYYFQMFIAGKDEDNKKFIDFIDKSKFISSQTISSDQAKSGDVSLLTSNSLTEEESIRLLKFMVFAHTTRHFLPLIQSKHTSAIYYLSEVIRDLNDFIGFPNLETPDIVNKCKERGAEITSENPVDRIPVYPLVEELNNITPPYNFSLEFTMLIPSEIRKVPINNISTSMCADNERKFINREQAEQINSNIMEINNKTDNFFGQSVNSERIFKDYTTYVNNLTNNIKNTKKSLVKDFNQRDKRLVKTSNNNNNDNDDRPVTMNTQHMGPVQVLPQQNPVMCIDVYDSDDDDEIDNNIERVGDMSNDEKLDFLLQLQTKTYKRQTHILEQLNKLSAINNSLIQKSIITPTQKYQYGNSHGLSDRRRKRGRKSKHKKESIIKKEKMSEEVSNRLYENFDNVPLGFELANCKTVKLESNIIEDIRSNAYLINSKSISSSSSSSYSNNNNINGKDFSDKYARSHYIKTKQKRYSSRK